MAQRETGFESRAVLIGARRPSNLHAIRWDAAGPARSSTRKTSRLAAFRFGCALLRVAHTWSFVRRLTDTAVELKDDDVRDGHEQAGA
jgi:hypothetical protein